MNIAIFHNLPAGGAKRVLYEQVKYLSNSHKLFLFEYTSTDEEFLNIRNYCSFVKNYRFSINQREGRLIRDFNSLIKLRYISNNISIDIDKLDIDVCLVHPDGLTQAPFVLNYLKTKSIYYCQEYLRMAYEEELRLKEKVNILKYTYERLNRIVRKKIDRDNSRKASIIVANSVYTSANIEKAYRRKVETCLPGVDCDLFQKTNISKNIALFVGSWEKINGSDTAEGIVTALNKKNIIQVNQLEFSKNITDKILAKKYSESMITLCLSYNEPFGLVPLESMSCETPVLAVNEGGYKETVIDGVTGYLLPRDPMIFADKIEYLMKNPDILRKMGKAGREHVKRNFTWEKHNNKLEKILLSFK